jgi:hypothetical protein
MARRETRYDFREMVKSISNNKRYPTLVTLLDGKVMIIGGNRKNLDFDQLTLEENNPTYEYYPAKAKGEIRLQLLVWAFPHMMYPAAGILPSGNVFVFASNKTIVINPDTDAVYDLPDMPEMDHAPWIYPHTPVFTYLPMTYKNNYRFILRLCGGSKLSSKQASEMCWEIEPDSPKPVWIRKADLPHARLMPDSVLMPDGTILYVNGLSNGQAGGMFEN